MFTKKIQDQLSTDVSTPIIPGPYGVILQDVEPMPRMVGVNLKAKY